MNLRFNRTTDAALKKFFTKELEELDKSVKQVIEHLQVNPTETRIFMSLVKLHEQFSHNIGRINTFKHRSAYRRTFGHLKMDVKLQSVFTFLYYNVAEKLADKIISPALASQLLTETINTFLQTLQNTTDGIRSKAA